MSVPSSGPWQVSLVLLKRYIGEKQRKLHWKGNIWTRPPHKWGLHQTRPFKERRLGHPQHPPTLYPATEGYITYLPSLSFLKSSFILLLRILIFPSSSTHINLLHLPRPTLHMICPRKPWFHSLEIFFTSCCYGISTKSSCSISCILHSKMIFIDYKYLKIKS